MLAVESNCQSLCWLYQNYSYQNMGSAEFHEKLELLLESDLKKKKTVLELNDVVSTINILGKK